MLVESSDQYLDFETSYDWIARVLDTKERTLFNIPFEKQIYKHRAGLVRPPPSSPIVRCAVAAAVTRVASGLKRQRLTCAMSPHRSCAKRGEQPQRQVDLSMLSVNSNIDSMQL